MLITMEKIDSPIGRVDGKILLKTEVMPDGKTKQILKDPETNKIIEPIL